MSDFVRTTKLYSGVHSNNIEKNGEKTKICLKKMPLFVVYILCFPSTFINMRTRATWSNPFGFFMVRFFLLNIILSVVLCFIRYECGIGFVASLIFRLFFSQSNIRWIPIFPTCSICYLRFFVARHHLP